MTEEKLLARYNAVSEYINNQTDEGWQQLMQTLMGDLGGVEVTLFDKAELRQEPRQVKLTVTAEYGSSGLATWLFVKADGYGEAAMVDGHGDLLCLEVYENDLRLIRSPDINLDEQQVISLESQREDRRIEAESINHPLPDGTLVEFHIRSEEPARGRILKSTVEPVDDDPTLNYQIEVLGENAASFAAHRNDGELWINDFEVKKVLTNE